MNKILKLSAIVAIFSPTLVQAQATSPMEVSATVIPGCFISADNINFGTLITPITTQSATSNMRVHCSKGSSLKINISYANQGTGSGSGNMNIYSWKVSYTLSNHYQYASILKNGLPSGNNDLECWNNYPGKLILKTELARELFGTSEYRINDTFGACNSGNTGFNSSFNLSSAIAGIKVGNLIGAVKGEEIKYSLEVPDNSSTVWNNLNAYTLVSSGVEQTIPMKANITASGNPTHRMSPDIYQDTLTATITY